MLMKIPTNLYYLDFPHIFCQSQVKTYNRFQLIFATNFTNKIFYDISCPSMMVYIQSDSNIQN